MRSCGLESSNAKRHAAGPSIPWSFSSDGAAAGGVRTEQMRLAPFLLAVPLVAFAAGIALGRRDGAPPPAARALVFAEETDLAGGDGAVYVARPDGGGRALVTDGRRPVISPDGRQIAFQRRIRDEVELRVVGRVGGEGVTIETAPWIDPVVWAPDSRRLAYVAGDALVAADADGSDRVVVVRGDRKTAAVGGPTFSPDSSILAFARSTLASSDVYTASSQGGELRRVTRDGRSGEPVWGAGGLAFTRYEAGGRGDVWVWEGAGEPRRLTTTRQGIVPIAWSADGDRLLAANPAVHNGRLWAVDARSGRARPLTDWVGDLFAQGLSRDGNWVLAAIGCGGTLSLRGVVERIPFAGGEPEVIARGPCRASWSA